MSSPNMLSDEFLGKHAPLNQRLHTYLKVFGENGPEFVPEQAELAICLEDAFHDLTADYTELEAYKDLPKGQRKSAFMRDRAQLALNWLHEVNPRFEVEDPESLTLFHLDEIALSPCSYLLNYVLLRYLSGSLYEVKPISEWTSEDLKLWENMHEMISNYTEILVNQYGYEDATVHRFFLDAVLRKSIFERYVVARYEKKNLQPGGERRVLSILQNALEDIRRAHNILDDQSYRPDQYFDIPKKRAQLANQGGMICRDIRNFIQEHPYLLQDEDIAMLYNEGIFAAEYFREAFNFVLTADDLAGLSSKGEEVALKEVYKIAVQLFRNWNGYHSDEGDYILSTQQLDRDHVSGAMHSYLTAMQKLHMLKKYLSSDSQSRTDARIAMMNAKFHATKTLHQILTSEESADLHEELASHIVEAWELIKSRKGVDQKIMEREKKHWQVFAKRLGIELEG